MPRIVSRVGHPAERYDISEVKLDRRGYLNVLTFHNGALNRRMDILERGSAVAALAVDRERRVAYLVEQPRFVKPFAIDGRARTALLAALRGEESERVMLAPSDLYALELPAGIIDEGESPADAMIRELREETGFDLSVDRLTALPRFYSTIGVCTELVYGFIADVTGLTPAPEAEGDGDEEITVWEYSWDELFALARDGKLESSTTLAILGRFVMDERAGWQASS